MIDDQQRRELEEVLSRQDGIIARRQALEAGLAPNDVRRLLRRRDWTLVHPGVYADHSGALNWQQRGWAAVQQGWPAALYGESALRAYDGPGRRARDDDLIHIAVDRDRSHFETPEGVVTHRLARLDSRVQWNLSPPRVRIEDTLIDLADQATSDWAAISRLADAVQARLTTAERLLALATDRKRMRRRSFLAAVLADIAEGSCSLLEHGYLTRVELPHGLPVAARQVRASVRGTIYRDVLYAEFGLAVELDGRLFHDSAQARDRDLDRDLDAAVAGLDTRRLGWGQVFDRACETAAKLGAVLQRRGWAGTPTACPGCRTGAQRGVQVSDPDTPAPQSRPA